MGGDVIPYRYTRECLRPSESLKTSILLVKPLLVPVAGLESIQLISRILVNMRLTRIDIAQSASRDFGVIFRCRHIHARTDTFGSPKRPQNSCLHEEGEGGIRVPGCGICHN